MLKNAKLSSPWSEYYNKLVAMFENDPEIKITFDEEAYLIRVYVSNTDKANALDRLLNHEVTFGSVTIKISVLPPKPSDDILEMYEIAFKGNPALAYVHKVSDQCGTPFQFVVFDDQVVQYFNDNLADIYGRTSTLYENIARDIFDLNDNALYCTDGSRKPTSVPIRVGRYKWGENL